MIREHLSSKEFQFSQMDTHGCPNVLLLNTVRYLFAQRLFMRKE